MTRAPHRAIGSIADPQVLNVQAAQHSYSVGGRGGGHKGVRQSSGMAFDHLGMGATIIGGSMDENSITFVNLRGLAGNVSRSVSRLPGIVELSPRKKSGHWSLSQTAQATDARAIQSSPISVKRSRTPSVPSPCALWTWTGMVCQHNGRSGNCRPGSEKALC